MTRKRKSPGNSPDGPGNHKRSCRQHGQPKTVEEEHENSAQLELPPPSISADMFKTIFTHQSAVPHKDMASPSASYERLEFLGDAYIEVMATNLIWERFPDLSAGRLSQLREILVKNETLGEIAVMCGFDKKIVVAADVKTNSKQWTKIKGDVIEAYVAAVVLADDKMGGSGYAAAESWLRQIWIPKLGRQLEERAPNMKAKDMLSRRVVSRGIKLEYIDELSMKQLPGGVQTYFIGAFITGWGYTKRRLGSGQGLSKTIAGNRAADDALQCPLTEEISKQKKEHDEMMRSQTVDYGAEDGPAKAQLGAERMTLEKELVEKKRDMFISRNLQ